MVEKLKELHKNAYAPISNFSVSASVVMNDGTVFYGVNVEDASLRAGTCAERNAIYNAITNGYTKGDFKELNVMVASGDLSYPCFVCRQMICEVFSKDAIVRVYNTKGEFKEHKVSELCPYPFMEEDLKKDGVYE